MICISTKRNINWYMLYYDVKIRLEISMAVTIYLNPITYPAQFTPHVFEEHCNKIQISKSFVYWYLLNIHEV